MPEKSRVPYHDAHKHDHGHEETHSHEGHHHNHQHGAGGCGGSACAVDAASTDADVLPDAGDLVWKVEGMDCASCAATITTALARLAGTQNVRVSLVRERLSLSLDERQTSREKIEKTVASLGYSAKAIAGGGNDREAHDEGAERRWWQSAKGRMAMTAGLLLALAFIVSTVVPQFTFLAYTMAALLSLVPVAKRAVVAFKNGSPFTIEMLMTIAAIGAIFINASQEAAVVVFLFCVGELLEGVAAGRARSGIKGLGKLTPKTAWRDRDGTLEEVAASDLAIGDIILARPGDRIAADGAVIDGMSTVNEAPITGESVPKLKEKGDPVYAGSINSEAALRIVVEKSAHDNTIARIIELVENAQDAKAPTERFIDGFARIYMPIIVAIALLTAIIPPLFGWGEWAIWIYRGLALLLIGCPCALVISVPASIASSLAAGTRSGLLVKGGQVLEMLAQITTITFDKTGTLTVGEPVVTDIISFKGSDEDNLAIAGSLERESSHPVAAAIVRHATKANIAPKSAGNVHAIAGKGIGGDFGGDQVFIGAPRFARDYSAFDTQIEQDITRLEDEGKTVVVMVVGAMIAAIIALRDEPREDAPSAIARLSALGIGSVMLTGDNQRTADAIAGQLQMQARAELLPEMKAEAIAVLRQKSGVAMVGDGINDAPALAAADVGIAMGSGTDVALETADAAILRNRMGDVPTLIEMARATMRNIHQNVAIALGLKLVFLITTILGVTGLWLAIMADTGATVLVTLNALRLLGFKPETSQ